MRYSLHAWSIDSHFLNLKGYRRGVLVLVFGVLGLLSLEW
jgi:hypothetical protein